MKTKRITLDAVLTALALSVFIIEQQIPLPIPVPGVKLGLSNVVTLFALFAVSPLDALLILSLRIGIGNVFAGSVTGLIFSAAGGLLCYVTELILYKFLTDRQIWVCGVFGAIAHGVGQIFAAVVVMATAEIFIYLPVLILCGIVTGALTGSLAQVSVIKLKKVFPFLPFHRKKEEKQN